MIKAGYSPSVRLFEAAACAVPVISDQWQGMEEFFTPGEEILLASTEEEVLRYLREFPESERREVGLRAREKALRCHSSARRAEELESYVKEVLQAG
jgi:spore maturation protein CgeB